MPGNALPFRIAVPDPTLEDLSARLARARWSLPPVLDGGEDAEVARILPQLVERWRTAYDWRAHERRLNEFPQFRAEIAGITTHFVHVPGTGPRPLPLLLTNGWPSSFVEYLDIVGPLTDPASHGGEAADAFSLVIPALPGYGFADRCLERPLQRTSIAGMFASLMTDVLGYRRFVVHGDDIGGGVANRLGMLGNDAVLAIQSANWIDPHVNGDASLTTEERAYLEGQQLWGEHDGAYSHVQATRPQTLAAGLNDSPLGLAAWIVEKFLTWSDPATRERLDHDTLITNVMIYWVTETIASSVRLYALPRGTLGPGDAVRAPAAVIVPNEPRLSRPPDSWLRRGYADLRRVVRIERGGHFLALESPARLVDEIRTTFRPFRPGPTP